MKPLRVVIVDDDSEIRSLLGSALDRHVVEVVGEAGDGIEGVRLAHELHPDVVVMDLMMPVMDGAEATRRIIAELPDIAVIGFTANDPASSSDLSQAGAAAVFDKTAFVELLDSLERLAVGAA